MEAMSQRWNDDRLDDLNRKVDDLARRVDNGFDRIEVGSLHKEAGSLRTELGALHHTLVLVQVGHLGPCRFDVPPYEKSSGSTSA